MKFASNIATVRVAVVVVLVVVRRGWGRGGAGHLREGQLVLPSGLAQFDTPLETYTRHILDRLIFTPMATTSHP